MFISIFILTTDILHITFSVSVYFKNQQTSEKMEEIKKEFLTLDTIKDRFPFLSKSTVLKLIADKEFPQGKQVRSRTIWSATEIELWLEER